MSAQEQFDHICNKFLENDKDIVLGKMMSAPGLKYKNKVFAFIWDDQMGFKLGKDYDIAAHGSRKWTYLSPFKTKPPMTAWYLITMDESEIWEELTQVAYDLMKKS